MITYRKLNTYIQFVQLRKFLPPHRQLSDEEKAKAKANLAKEVLFVSIRNFQILHSQIF